MTSTSLLHPRVHRELRKADEALCQEESEVNSHIEQAVACLDAAERRRSGAMVEMERRLEERKRLARMIPNGMELAKEDLATLMAQRRECEAEWNLVVARAHDLLGTLRARLDTIHTERRALRSNTQWVECELAAAQIMDLPQPRARERTIATVEFRVNARGNATRTRAKVEGAQKALQKTIDEKRITRDEPFADLPAPGFAPTPDAPTPTPDGRKPADLERAPPDPTGSWAPAPTESLDEVRVRAASRRTPRRDLLPRLIIIGCLAFLLILLGAFIGRALTPCSPVRLTESLIRVSLTNIIPTPFEVPHASTPAHRHHRSLGPGRQGPWPRCAACGPPLLREAG